MLSLCPHPLQFFVLLLLVFLLEVTVTVLFFAYTDKVSPRPPASRVPASGCLSGPSSDAQLPGGSCLPLVPLTVRLRQSGLTHAFVPGTVTGTVTSCSSALLRLGAQLAPAPGQDHTLWRTLPVPAPDTLQAGSFLEAWGTGPGLLLAGA